MGSYCRLLLAFNVSLQAAICVIYDNAGIKMERISEATAYYQVCITNTISIFDLYSHSYHQYNPNPNQYQYIVTPQNA